MSNKKYILVKVTSEENDLNFEFLEQLISTLSEATQEKKICLKLIEEYKKFPLCENER